MHALLPENLIFNVARHVAAIYEIMLVSKADFEYFRAKIGGDNIPIARDVIYLNCANIETTNQYIDWAVAIHADDPRNWESPLSYAIYYRNTAAIEYIWGRQKSGVITTAAMRAVWLSHEDSGYDEEILGEYDTSEETRPDLVMREYLKFLDNKQKLDRDQQLGIDREWLTLLDILAAKGYPKSYKWAKREKFNPSPLNHHTEPWYYAVKYDQIATLGVIFDEGDSYYDVIKTACECDSIKIFEEIMRLNDLLGGFEQHQFVNEEQVWTIINNGSAKIMAHLLSMMDRVTLPDIGMDMNMWNRLIGHRHWDMIEVLCRNKDVFAPPKRRIRCNVIYQAVCDFIHPKRVKWLLELGFHANLTVGGRYDLIRAALECGHVKFVVWAMENLEIAGKYDRYNEDILREAVCLDSVKLLKCVSAERLRQGISIEKIAKHRAVNILKWLRIEYKDIDVMISKEDYSRALELIGR